MIEYNDFNYLWPPRPEQAVPSTLLHHYERSGWSASFKKNGTCSIIAVHPKDHKLIAMNRHNEVHKAWTPTDEVMATFYGLPGDYWYVFVAELLHNKGGGYRNVNYIHDILVVNGEYLVGSTHSKRYAILHDDVFKSHIRNGRETYSHHELDQHTWLAIEYDTGFKKLYDGITDEIDEGLVLRDPNVPLAYCTRQKANTLGLAKCRRKVNTNYSF